MAESKRGHLHYGWVMVLMAFLVLSTYGIFFSYGVFFKPMMNEFGWDRAQTSLVFSIYMVIYTFSSIPMGWLFDRYGPRIPLYVAAVLIGVGFSLCSLTNQFWQLWLCFGVIGGIGFGAIYVVPVSTVMMWFREKRGLAVGMVVAGIGAGIAAVPPIADGLISLRGWRTAFVVMGLAYFVILLVAATILRKNPEALGLKPYGIPDTAVDDLPLDTIVASPTQSMDLTVWEALRTRSFWMLYISIAIAFSAESLAIVHVVPFAQDMGIASAMAAGAVTLIGIGSIAGRLSMGALSDRIGRRTVLTISYCIEGIVFLSLIWVGNITSLYLVMFITGFSFGGFSSVFAPTVGEYFGLTHMGKILAAAFSNGAIAGVLGPWLAGYIFDVSGSYRAAFMVAGALCFVAVACSFLIISEVKKRARLKGAH